MPVIINGTTGIDTVQDGIVTDAKLSLTANSQEIKDSLNASGSAPIYACRAWVNFNGTGTVAIRASGNVSSITDGGVGIYIINFTNALVDANYAISSSISQRGGVTLDTTVSISTIQNINVEILTLSNGTLFDDDNITLGVFR